MGDINRDPELDRADKDPRPDIEQAIQSRSDEADAVEGGDDTSPLEPTGVPDGVSGTAGEVKNQDRTQQ
ncbi:hypothetical protein ACMGDH_11520 [Sphingomonas sp. DT-207]|uniref:hypothetical protein n=1 Tax=Sphingomonas sp. DT-207 TaxID=3396167 RepID=UPI003F1AE285